MRKILLGVMACTLVVSSCQKDEVFDSTQKKERELSYNLVMGQQTTRTAEMMPSALQDEEIDLWAYYNAATATASRQNTQYFKDVLSHSATNGWETSITRFVPVGEKLDFFAVHPQGYTINRTGAVTTLDYTVKANPAEQEDLIAAAWIGEAAGNASNDITLSMRHLLSQVNFGVYGYKGAQIKIENIRVNSVNQTGTYTLAHNAQGSWTVDNTTTVSYNYSQIGNTVPYTAEIGHWYVFGDGGNFAVSNQNNIDKVWYYDGPAGWKSGQNMDPLTNSLMLMPQVLPATASVTFDYTIVDGEGNPVVNAVGASFNLADAGQREWKQNCRYVYMLDFEDLLRSRMTTFKVNVIAWENWEVEAGGTSPGTGSVNIEYEVQNVATIHILPNDPNLSNGVYTIPDGLLAPLTEKVILIFDDTSKPDVGTHNQNISIVIPTGFDLPIELDFSQIAKRNTNLTIDNPDYKRLITLVDHYKAGNPILLQSINLGIPNGSFDINADYNITGSSSIITASTTFTLNAGAKMNNLSVKGGRAMIYGDLSALNVSGEGTEVYIKNSKVDGFWFRTSDINTFKTSNGFRGFDVMELLNGIDISQLGDVLKAIQDSGLIDMGGFDLGALFDLGGKVDLNFLSNMLKMSFYYCGASTDFTNPYVRTNFSSLKGVEYNLVGNGRKYTASLPKLGVTNMPILEQINAFKNATGSLSDKIGLNLAAVPTFYAATDNFSMQGIVDLFDMYYSIVSLVKTLESYGSIEYIQSLYDGTLWSTKYGITDPAKLATIPLRENYSSTLMYNIACGAWATSAGVSVTQIVAIVADMALKSVIDLAIEGYIGELDPAMIASIMGSLTQITGLLDTVTPIVDKIYGPIKKVQELVNNLQAYNPWAYNANGAAFTRTTTITGMEAAFSIDANGIGIVINNAYVK